MPPARRSTCPQACPRSGVTAFTVAEKVTGWPNTEVLEEAVTAVVVAICLSVSVMLPLLAVQLVSPL